ncbi:DNA-binding LytR/AlgR family response regulator [Pelomonas saccharophila]|uniref:DNA-binding LytR/AlgR family response regulator n=1 Tax=Roseateles saccharophilus TaxID=304 RepID=A0ABU1YNV3_ROSSA|nr:LytTR family DNA-binding domain-containing protein [Roseateles saccharophilus]MDR7270524.1 DNA-binding LytR/AlgR family response regulator [Roseateles saccharophilus]
MRVLIVDDEPAARAKLRRLLATEVDVAELLEAPDAPAALALVGALPAPPDLALLDIEMPGGNGVQLAAALRQAGVRCIIFSTAHAEHALQAFELAALDYLLKPYTAERLAAALVRVRELLERPAPPVGEWWVEGERIQLAEVHWISAADNYIELHLPPRSLLERATLADALARPGWAARFLRVHRSHAVNLAQVRRIERLASGEAVLTLSGGETLRVSRGYRSVLDSFTP